MFSLKSEHYRIPKLFTLNDFFTMKVGSMAASPLNSPVIIHFENKDEDELFT